MLPSELAEVVDALDFFLRRVEDRHVQQAAWMGAMVHDIKTPVAACANAIAVVLSSPSLEEEERQHLLRDVGAELRHLLGDVKQMLDAVRFAREDLAVERAQVDLRALVRKAVERIEPGPASVIAMRGEGAAAGDARLLVRVVENLVGNALRYARTRVEVDVFPGLIRVADDGIGLPVPLEQLSTPFRSEPVRQGESVIPGGEGGIGLFVARRILEAHGGKLVVESSDHRGTVLLAYVGAHRGS